METEQVVETILMKKSKKKHKDKKLRGEDAWKRREIELYRKWQALFPSLRSSKIERNCTLVNTNINLQLAYYILEFPENVFSRTSRAQRRI